MPEDHFHVGLRLSLAVNNSYNRFDMSIVGWAKQTFLLATGPDLKDLDISSIDDCILRFVKEGVAFGFKTSMQIRQNYPIPLIFFKYPEEIKSMPFRKSVRVATNIPAKIMKRTGEKEFITAEAKIIDLNETGCLLEVPASVSMSFEVDTEYFLNFFILDKNVETYFVARNIRKQNDNYRLGSQFHHMSKTTAELLQTFARMFAEQ